MSKQTNPSAILDSATRPSGDKAKKPYHAPSWEVEQVFEKTALSCSKADDSSCSAGPIQS